MSEDKAPGFRLGGIMLAVGFAASLGLLAFLAAGFSERRAAERAAPTSVELADGGDIVRLRRGRGGHYVTSGEINGHSVTFLLDTGATSVAIPAGVARQVGAPRGASVLLNTANGTSRGHQTDFESVRIGSIELRDVHGVIAPGMEGEAVLLGMSFLRRVDFSQQGGYLVLRKPDAAR